LTPARGTPATGGREAGSKLLLDSKYDPGSISDDNLADLYEEVTAVEVEATEEAVTDNATTAQTLVELAFEIETLKAPERLSKRVVDQRCEAKWSELDRILDEEQMWEPNGGRRRARCGRPPACGVASDERSG